MSDLLKPASFCSAGELLYLNEDMSDLLLMVKDAAAIFRFPVHALILSVKSSVFKSMIQESKQNDDSRKEIIITDMTPSTTELLLCYFYSGKLKLQYWTEGVDLLCAAFKYKVGDLVQKCGRFLEDVISLCNVCYIYDKAFSCSLPALQDKCLKLILDAGFFVLKRDAFESLHKECIIDVVSSLDLNINSELDVFEMLFRWARVQCCRANREITENNILSELKPILQHVCIDDMSDADKGALPSAVLSCVQPNNRNRIRFCVPESLLPYSQKLLFETTRMLYDFTDLKICCLRFSMDHSLYLIGLSFMVSSPSAPFFFSLTLMKENHPLTVLFNNNVSASSWNRSFNPPAWYSADVLLKQPVLLNSGDIYSLIAEFNYQCPKVILSNPVLRTSNGLANFTIHGETLCGVTSLTFV